MFRGRCSPIKISGGYIGTKTFSVCLLQSWKRAGQVQCADNISVVRAGLS